MTAGDGPSDPVVGLISSSMQQSLAAKQKEFKEETVKTIFAVPPSVRDLDKQAFDPEFVAIGPLHRQKGHLKPMENIKWRYLHDLIKRSTESNSIAKYAKAVSECHDKAKSFYAESETLPEGKKVFVEMLVLDGCFIIELLLKYNFGSPGAASTSNNEDDDDTLWKMPHIGIDLLLMENQIPFFVLEKLFNRTEFEGKSAAVKLQDLALDYILARDVTDPNIEGSAEPTVDDGASAVAPAANPQVEIELTQIGALEIYHLLHLYHWYNSQHVPPGEGNSCFPWRWCKCCWTKLIKGFIFHWFILSVSTVVYILFSCSLPRPSSEAKSTPSIPCAQDLWRAGVEFKRKEQRSYFKAEFDKDNGILSIPEWHVDKRTKSYFWNLMAFQKCQKANNDFFKFAIFMSYLMCTPADVEILERSKIIHNNLGKSEDLILFFKDLSRGGMPHHARLLFKDEIAYCKSSQRLWRARVASDFAKLVPYFSSPWVIASVVIAVLLLCFGVAQGVYNIIKFYHPRSPLD